MARFTVRSRSSIEDVSLDDGVEYKFYMPKGHKIIRYVDVSRYMNSEFDCYDPENVRITLSPGVKYSYVFSCLSLAIQILFEHEDPEYEGYIYVKLSYVGDK